MKHMTRSDLMLKGLWEDRKSLAYAVSHMFSEIGSMMSTTHNFNSVTFQFRHQL